MKQKTIYYICDHVAKCKQFNHPKHECLHAVKHEEVDEKYGYCHDERDCICKGKCKKVKPR